MDHINGFKAAVAAVLGCLTALWGWFGWLVVAWVACMLLDYATGTAAALKAGKWSCKAAREGLWHKVGAMAAVLVAAILDGVLGLILDHIPALTLPFDYTVFLTVLVLVWYILTELGSIVENAGRLGAPLPAWLSKAIAALESGVDSAGDKLTQGEKKEEKEQACSQTTTGFLRHRGIRSSPGCSEECVALRPINACWRLSGEGGTFIGICQESAFTPTEERGKNKIRCPVVMLGNREMGWDLFYPVSERNCSEAS